MSVLAFETDAAKRKSMRGLARTLLQQAGVVRAVNYDATVIALDVDGCYSAVLPANDDSEGALVASAVALLINAALQEEA